MLVEAAGVDVRSHTVAVDFHLVGCAAEAGLRGSVAAGVDVLAVDLCIELGNTRAE